MAATVAESAEALDPQLRGALRDLVLVLADSKRLLGYRYGSWILGAPTLEAGIACASMAQDEWGHARLLYALLKDFGEDVDALEHERDPDDYVAMEPLDREPATWAGVVALNALADTALAVQIEALRDCCYLPLRQRTEKVLAEERYHAAHGGAWARRYLHAGPAASAALAEAIRSVLPGLLRWFGPPGGRGRLLADAGAADADADALRERFRERTGPVLRDLADDGLVPAVIDYTGFDEARRRGSGGSPDVATIVRIRGDRNREFLIDA
jgi:ring-1,2-phenylacetyl-CoA epoxidase subunit PaaC